MHRVHRFVLLAVASLALLPSVSWAQAQASIAGVARDTSGAVLPGVTVEASSPALIEKVRSVVSSATGQYQIVNLRPGTYVVTFTLPGFSTVRRENIELTGSNTVTVNADMAVGSVAETLTVTGESPIVDVQNTAAQRSIDKQVIDSVPAGRNHIQYGVLIPGVTSGTRDVGGTRTLALASMAIHGGRTNDQRVTVDGLVIRNVGSAGNLTNLFPDMSSTQEITMDYGAVSAETMSGGIRINYIPQQGGNNLSGRFFGTYVNNDFQANNFSPELAAAGLRQPNSLNKSYDINPSVGGAIIKDKLWFYVGFAPQLSQTDVTRTTKRERDCQVVQADGTLSACKPQPTSQGGFADGVPDVDPKTGFFLTDKVDSEIRSDTARNYSLLTKINYAANAQNQGQLAFQAQPGLELVRGFPKGGAEQPMEVEFRKASFAGGVLQQNARFVLRREQIAAAAQPAKGIVRDEG